jgi:acetyltransferase-like isoleucine patch superfamily enzyme
MSQLRKYSKRGIFHKLRSYFWSLRLGYLGSNVLIENNVKILRFPKNVKISDNVFIKEGVRICSCNEKAQVNIGNNTTIGYHTFIFASENISIGQDCLIAPFVYLVDSNHKIEKSLKINQQGNETAPIIIEDDVWIASNVTILKGVEIKKGAVIAANSVVNTNVGEYEIWGGSPAKKIGERK